VNAAADIRSVLAVELHQLAADLHAHAAALGAGSEEAASECLTLCERLGQVGQMLDAPALQDTAMFLLGNIPSLVGNAPAANAPAELCACLELCLLEGTASEHWHTLSGVFSRDTWPGALEIQAASELVDALKPLANAVPAEVEFKQPLTAADFSLQPARTSAAKRWTRSTAKRRNKRRNLHACSSLLPNRLVALPNRSWPRHGVLCIPSRDRAI
jgi:hypothetical protein